MTVRPGKKGVSRLRKLAIDTILKLDSKNNKRPIEGDLFCEPVPGYRPRINSNPKIQSPLYWGREPIELKELLTALSLDVAFENAQGDPMPFTEVVRTFESFLNIKLGTAGEVKRLTFERDDQTPVTNYLELLIAGLKEEKSRRDKRRAK